MAASHFPASWFAHPASFQLQVSDLSDPASWFQHSASFPLLAWSIFPLQVSDLSDPASWLQNPASFPASALSGNWHGGIPLPGFMVPASCQLSAFGVV